MVPHLLRRVADLEEALSAASLVESNPHQQASIKNDVTSPALPIAATPRHARANTPDYDRSTFPTSAGSTSVGARNIAGSSRFAQSSARGVDSTAISSIDQHKSGVDGDGGVLLYREGDLSYYVGSSGGPFMFHQLDDWISEENKVPHGTGSEPDSNSVLGTAVLFGTNIAAPSASLARQCVRFYIRYISWLYTPVPNDSIASVFANLYGEALEPISLPSEQILNSNPLPRISPVSLVDLAVFNEVIALGALVSPLPIAALGDGEPTTWTSTEAMADELHNLTSVLLVKAHSLRQPSIMSCRAMHLQVDIVADRKHLFWETFTFDVSLALTFGRPLCVSVSPKDIEQLYDGQEVNFDRIKHRLAVLSSIIATETLVARRQSYERVLDLDHQLRQIEENVPPHLQVQDDQTEAIDHFTPGYRLQGYLLQSMISSARLFLHKPWLVLSLRQGLSEPLDTTFGPSFRASIEAAQSAGRMMQSLCLHCPHEVSVWWMFSFHSIGAATMLAACITEAPRSSLALGAWRDLRLLADAIINNSSNYLAEKATPLLDTLVKEARQAMSAAASQSHASGSLSGTKRPASSFESSQILSKLNPDRLATSSSTSGTPTRSSPYSRTPTDTYIPYPAEPEINNTSTVPLAQEPLYPPVEWSDRVQFDIFLNSLPSIETGALNPQDTTSNSQLLPSGLSTDALDPTFSYLFNDWYSSSNTFNPFYPHPGGQGQ
ncbi:hypothetical protein P7C73_g1138, partial [Tremellales sp. Uapishka_1]